MTSVTIGLPFHNSLRTLPTTLRSIFAQSLGDWQLILVDDGSTDGSGELAESVDDPRVAVIRDGVNRGLAARLNELAWRAETEFLCRMDADDLMHPERLRRQVEYLRRHPEVDVLGTQAISIDEEGRLRGLRARRRQAPDYGPGAVLKSSPHIHPTVMARTAWFREHPYSEEYPRAEDRELWCRVAATARLATMPEPLLFYREPRRVLLRNYVGSCRSDRRIFRRYGPALVGRVATTVLVARSHLKEICYRAAAAVELEHLLVSRRSVPLTAHERAAAKEVLRGLERVVLPLRGERAR
jgi:glycosyltransferase involved in cell wall biosynthesis